MTETLLDLSNSEKPRQIQKNLIAYMSLFAELPNMLKVDDDVYWFMSNKPAAGNIILRANWSDAEVEEKIDSTLAAISQYVDEIGWFVFPGDQPSDLGKRLEARGMP